jgi:hypothetical protein
LPAFADKIERVMQYMRARGHDAVVFEAYRSPVRVAHLVQVGTGVSDSMHEYGGAVDIVDRKLLWNASAAFKRDLIAAVEAEGLTSGHTFSNKDDWAHAQAVPVRLEQAFRGSTIAERNRLVA